MSVVIDASMVIAWILPDENHPHADEIMVRVSKSSGIVPAHWWFEVRNVLLMATRRSRVHFAQVPHFLRLLGDIPTAIDHAPDEGAIFALARSHGLSFYDAAYLELARRHDGLASLDKKLLAAARAEGVAVIGEG